MSSSATSSITIGISGGWASADASWEDDSDRLSFTTFFFSDADSNTSFLCLSELSATLTATARHIPPTRRSRVLTPASRVYFDTEINQWNCQWLNILINKYTYYIIEKGKYCVFSQIWPCLSTVKHFIFARTLFSRKFARPVTRENKVNANISLVSIIVKEMNNRENKVSWINPKSWAHEN